MRSVQPNEVVLLRPFWIRWCLLHPVYFWTLGRSEISCEISTICERVPIYTECPREGLIEERLSIQRIRLRNSFFPNLFAMRKQADIYEELWNSAESQRKIISTCVSSSQSHLRNRARITEDRFPCERTIHVRKNPGLAGREDFHLRTLKPLGTLPLKVGILWNHNDR